MFDAVHFTPSPDVALILGLLLDRCERHHASSLPKAEGLGVRARPIRVDLDRLELPNYHSQSDPTSRQITNEQLQKLERLGYISLAWLTGETGHLLANVTLAPEYADPIFALLRRTPLAAQRQRLSELLRADQFRFGDWRLRAVLQTLTQLREEKSAAPFSLSDEAFNQDLLTAMAALDAIQDETPYRVFSVRVFNDSKRFEDVLSALATLARRHEPEWRELSNDEVLRELNLVGNPTHLFLYGAWQMVDADGHVISLANFRPSMGLAAAQAMHVQHASVDAPRVICVENPTSFYELIRSTLHAPGSTPLASLCLFGNPSPATRHLLARLSPDMPLLVWADIDYGGLNILAQLREQVNPKAQPHWIDIETLERHAAFARPLSVSDRKNLERLARRPSLADMRPLIAHLLQRGLKLEQEAIRLSA